MSKKSLIEIALVGTLLFGGVKGCGYVRDSIGMMVYSKMQKEYTDKFNLNNPHSQENKELSQRAIKEYNSFKRIR